MHQNEVLMIDSNMSALAGIQIVIAAMTMVGCGPTCPEIKMSLDEKTATSEDVARINALVKKRKAAIAEAEAVTSNTFELKRLKFSVTAYEKAIETQARVIKISPSFGGSDKYEENIELISELRCFLDRVAENPDYAVSDRTGREIQRLHDMTANILRKDGALTKRELREYIEEGIGSN
jgi:hypothetical protein